MKRLMPMLLLLLLPCVAQAKPSLGANGKFVFIVGDDIGRLNMGYSRTAGVDTTADAQPATPNLDAMATAGVRLDGLLSGPNCTASRQMIHGYGAAQRPTNRHGTVVQTSVGGAWRSTVTVNPADHRTIFRRAEAAGFTTFYAGKFHASPDRIEQGLENILSLHGIDVAPSVIQSNPPHPMSLLDSVTVPSGAEDYLGHSCWVGINLAGTVSLNTTYNNLQFANDAISYIQGDGATGKHFMFVAGAAPHLPAEYTTGATCPSLVSADDRPPGDTTSASQYAVFNSGIEYFDTQVGRIRDELSLDPTTGTDILCVIGDNGLPGFGAPSEIETNRWKSNPYPAGVQVPMVCEGVGIEAGSVITAKFGFTDLNKTIDAILTGGGGGGHLDGQSFADCLDDNTAATNCEGPEGVLIQHFAPLGGSDGTWQSSPQNGDSSGVPGWTKDWLLYVTGPYWINRIYLTGTTRGPFYEQFFDENEAGVSQYWADGDEIAETAAPGGGALVTGDFTAQTADELAAMNAAHRAFDLTQINGGGHRDSVGGAFR